MWVHGDQQDLDETVATYGPTLKSTTLHLIKLCVGFIFGLVSLADGCLQHINFLNVPLPDATPVYMHAPKGYGRP